MGYAPPSTLQYNWSGIYFGASLGSGDGDATTSFFNNTYTTSIAENVFSIIRETTTNLVSGNLKGDINGAMANLFVGSNIQSMNYANFVFGGQLEGNFFNDITLATNGTQNTSKVVTTDDGVLISTTTTQSTAGVELRDTLSSMFTFLGRAGVLAKPNTLVYLLGGGVEGHFVIPSDTVFDGQKRNKWSTGYVLGTGIEYRLNDKWSLRGEYRYVDFSNIKRNGSITNTTFTNPDGPNNSTNTTTNIISSSKTGFNFNAGMIAVVYQFG